MRENKIRILHVAQAAGGVDCYIRMLLKYLDKEKFENIMVCSQDFRKEDYNRLADHFEQIEMTRAIGVNDLKVIKAVRKLIKKYNPDIVYAHSSKAGAVARVANIGIKNYCIYNPHGWAFNMKCSAKKKAMYTAIEKVAALFCDKIICISDAEEKSALEKKICREEKLQVILNGVDIEAYENGVHGTVTRRDLDIPKDAFVVGMVGRICPQKAPDIFVRMANQVRNKVPNAHFIIVGNGNQEAEIRKYAEKNGFSDSLHITGFLFSNTKAECYIIDDRRLVTEIQSKSIKKGKYNLFTAFSVEYIDILKGLLDDKRISFATFEYIKKDMSYFLSILLYEYIIKKQESSYDLQNYKEAIGKNYSYLAIVCNIPYVLFKNKFLKRIKKCMVSV